MKKIILSLSVVFLYFQKTQACSWYDPDYDYFNLFTQNIIKNKALSPFLLTYSNAFYDSGNPNFQDDNILDWQKYFDQKLNYSDTYQLVYKMSMNDLNLLKKGIPTHPLLKKLGSDFYSKYKDGLDYLIEAKYLEPYMRIKFGGESEDSFYQPDENEKNATNLNFQKTTDALKSLYQSTNNPSIKMRYGFQLVRFYHYNRDFKAAIDAFKTYVEPLNLKTSTYYLALNQLAGAQRGVKNLNDSNWNFFQVFMHSNTQKKSAYSSLRLFNEDTFNQLLSRAKTNEEKSFAYFLLGYQDYNNPIPMMEKIYAINPKSELLQVLAARAVNELERAYLPTYYQSDLSQPKVATTEKKQPEVEVEKPGFFARIWNFIVSLFSKSSPVETTQKADLSNPNRIPFYTLNSDNEFETSSKKDYLSDLSKFTEQVQSKDDSEFWKITDAYLQFLNKEYSKSNDLLNEINTNNPDYLAQIKKMKMLNDIVSRPVIDDDFEKHLYQDYKELFAEKPQKTTDESSEDYGMSYPSPEDFIRDVLANRYFLQGDFAKSFLMNNDLSDFRNDPNYDLAVKLNEFNKKQNKNSFETEVIAKNMNSVGNTDAYFNLVFGDFAMRNAEFEKAKDYYDKAKDFSGYTLDNEVYNYNTQQMEKVNTSTWYNGYKNISSLVFGHNKWVSFGSDANQTMIPEVFKSEFPFIKPVMNKSELAQCLLELKKIGQSQDPKASWANQLIGNLLYNTSSLGYYRELFVMDINNGDGGKYRFADKPNFEYHIYYKGYGGQVFAKPDNFDLSLNYYKKALDQTSDKEQKARILFQMASAEQGKYYQWQTNNSQNIDYTDPKYDQKIKLQAENDDKIKREKFKTYFTQLKQNYTDTETSKSLMGSCSYYSYFLKH